MSPLEDPDPSLRRYPPPNEDINTALATCEDERKIAEDEERLGFEVGKRVMLKIVTKYGSFLAPSGAISDL